MEIKIALFQQALMATYYVDKEDPSTFNLRLKNFSGVKTPPSYIKIYKTELGWRSAFEDAELIRELGIAIDSFSAS